ARGEEHRRDKGPVDGTAVLSTSASPGRFSRSAPGYRLDAGAGAHDPAEQAEVALPRLARGARGRDAARGVGKAAERADGAQFIHTHRWRVHDLVMWDN